MDQNFCKVLNFPSAFWNLKIKCLQLCVQMVPKRKIFSVVFWIPGFRMQAQPILPSWLLGLQFEADIKAVSRHLLLAGVEEVWGWKLLITARKISSQKNKQSEKLNDPVNDYFSDHRNEESCSKVIQLNETADCNVVRSTNSTSESNPIGPACNRLYLVSPRPDQGKSQWVFWQWTRRLRCLWELQWVVRDLAAWCLTTIGSYKVRPFL